MVKHTQTIRRQIADHFVIWVLKGLTGYGSLASYYSHEKQKLVLMAYDHTVKYWLS